MGGRNKIIEIKKELQKLKLFFVPGTGLEPAHLAAYAPETYASTNSAIRAFHRLTFVLKAGAKIVFFS